MPAQVRGEQVGALHGEGPGAGGTAVSGRSGHADDPRPLRRLQRRGVVVLSTSAPAVHIQVVRPDRGTVAKHPSPMSRTASPPRLSGPGELAAALPLLCGFAPSESLVLVALEPGSSRVGLTLRLDLPCPADAEQVARELAERVRRAGAGRVFAFVVTEQPGHEDRILVEALLDQPGLDLLDVVEVRTGRWRSLLCTDRACCPEPGRPVPATSPSLTLVRAEAALTGRDVLPSRAALVAALAAPATTDELLTRFQAKARRLEVEVQRTSRSRRRRRLVRSFRRALVDLTGVDGDELALGLSDVLVRDEVLTWSAADGERLLAVLLHLARCTPSPFDAGVCATLAWVAYTRGDGATASIALERSLTTAPDHGLARLLQGALDQQVAPRELLAVAERTLSGLRRQA